MNFNLFQSSNNNNQLGQSPLDFMSDDDGELDFSAVMQQELESHDLLLMQSEAAAHHHPLSPPTVIIPSSSSNNINNNCAADDGDLYKSNVLASVGDHQNMMFPLNFVGGHTTPHVNTTTSNDQQQHSPRTPRLNLDAASVLQSWLLILDNTITNNNNNNNINNNNHNSSTTTPIHNNNNNLNNNNNNNNNINLNNINHHTTYNNTTSDQNLQDTLENLIQNNKHRQQIHDMLTNNNNNSSNTTTSMQSQSYLGSVLANCTSIHSPNMRSTMNQRNHSHQHSKSPSFGSGNYNSKLNSGVRKASSQRSNSTSCFQSIQSYTASKMHLAAASATSMMNMNGGLNSPSVASTCSSNLTMSPANVSTNSFNQLINNNNNGHMGYMSNSNSNNNSSATVGSSSNQQYSPIVTNQQQMVAGATVSGSNKKGKLPANRPVVDKNSNNQFTFVNSQHSKGLLVEANPNDKPIKMQQCKIVDGGIKIQIEDGISKNKKDTGLQFHTCTFK